MNRLLSNIEFFTHEEEVLYRLPGESVKTLTQADTEIVDGLNSLVETFYPKAFNALAEEYKGCALNRRYFNFRRAARFIRCNFAQYDNAPDVTETGLFNFEYVPCPLRGECPYDRVICRPEFDSKISPAEMPVMELWYKGMNEGEIAEKLFLSPHTVHNHIRNAYRRVGVRSRAEFVLFASSNNLFKDEI